MSTKPAWTKHVLPLTLVAIGLVLILLQAAGNFGNYLKAQLVKVDYPASYDFATYNQLLGKYVKNGLVDYQGLAASPELNKAVDEVAHVSPDHFADAKQKLAFWINTYNLLILKSVVDHYPLTQRSLLTRDLSLHKFIIAGETLAVEDMKAKKLNPLLPKDDPRPAFLLCGGALGYPALTDHALSHQTLIDDAEAATRKFMEDKSNVHVNDLMETMTVSQFLQWNEEFINYRYGTPFEFANQYLPKEQQLDTGSYRFKGRYFPEFNWTLNDLALKPAEPKQ